MAANAPEIESVSIDGGKIESPASREIIQVCRTTPLRKFVLSS